MNFRSLTPEDFAFYLLSLLESIGDGANPVLVLKGNNSAFFFLLSGGFSFCLTPLTDWRVLPFLKSPFCLFVCFYPHHEGLSDFLNTSPDSAESLLGVFQQSEWD